MVLSKPGVLASVVERLGLCSVGRIQRPGFESPVVTEASPVSPPDETLHVLGSIYT